MEGLRNIERNFVELGFASYGEVSNYGINIFWAWSEMLMRRMKFVITSLHVHIHCIFSDKNRVVEE